MRSDPSITFADEDFGPKNQSSVKVYLGSWHDFTNRGGVIVPENCANVLHWMPPKQNNVNTEHREKIYGEQAATANENIMLKI